MNHFKTIQDVWNAIEDGKEIFWHHEGYKVIVEEPNNPNYKPENIRRGKVLTVRCLDNWFGSLLSEYDLPNLYIKK